MSLQNNTSTDSSTPLKPALEVHSVSMSFSDRRKVLPVLDDISLTVSSGEFVSIIGPSGCGKSTLFHIIGGLNKPGRGYIYMQGKDVTGQRGHISYVPQQPALLPWRNIQDNVLLAGEIAGITGQTAKEDAEKWIARAGLEGFENAYPHTLSGGMQQRASFVRGLLAPQEIMCLDEPFSALDALTRSDMQRWLLDMWEESHRSVLMITHSIEEALMLSDTIYLFSSRPARVLQKITVPFPRPRREEIVADSAFLELKREIGIWMTEEQRKSSSR
ncbi:ABC-type nitrate/sulfonate/bicarbonate transport system ATPase subunit [Fontibacillus solani]|uniref:ABC-type nitrate/sulfonate/bicarbonate transport system ATPase subunit n=1 Tax=Fontibacillus solani TaxID=1572857 RepID=A0A7W3SP25_9BACL|nr:ABC transporter ATP-binding protein [Fontibacillus solani]MBA9083605.1 ABC-type nitrate/sulfonate/bicarbonate transport system ATPase subunit [Fontibacillus solani]